ncbi:uncharacterized protein LOC120116617 [Hibiscus syriacus]|uniref:uncharacterized protein LOC120116617 n=1 Tax=Hibiscus syriacus TaxID=106335 RepID=UPI001924B8AA|nr:uncharacterized protein LOC120116617 [Hibiscus syriacus]
MADILATLASTFKAGRKFEIMPIDMQSYEYPAHCYQIEEVKDTKLWYHNILQYIKNRSYPEEAIETDKRTIRRMTAGYILDGEVLYKKSHDQILLRIIIDNATNLKNKMMDGSCEQFNIKHHNSTAYRPKVNRAVEVSNKIIKKIVEKTTETYKD